MNRTKIEYLDYTWNPIVGCEGIGCAVREHCWARAQAKRRKRKCEDCYTFRPHYHAERIDQPLHVKKPSRIGVGFMADIFDKAYGIAMHQGLFWTMDNASWHTFLCLTKQTKNMLTFNRNWQTFPNNVWMGVTVNRREDLYRIDDLVKTEARIKYVSFEPLYEDLGSVDLEDIDWIIIGAQTRPLMRPPIGAASKLEGQAHDLGIPVFVKKNLSLGSFKEFPKEASN